MKKLLLVTAVTLGLNGPALAETVHVGVDGLVCAFCVKGIENSFKKQDAVEKISVDLDQKLLTLTTKPDKKIDDETIKSIVTDAGYTMTTIHRQK